MKKSVKLLIIIVGLISAYTLYGMMTIQPDDPVKFTFNKPNLPPELFSEAKSEIPEGKTPEEIAEGQKAFALYQSFQDNAPSQALETLSILNSRIFKWEVPAYFASMGLPPTNLRSLQTLNLDPSRTASTQPSQNSVSCMGEEIAQYIIGNDEDNILECTTIKPNNMTDRLFLGGPGNDKITDAFGNRIVNGGSGNDTIALGQGRSLIVLDTGWGHDELTIDCKGAKIADGEVKDIQKAWSYPYMNFIILSTRIEPKNVVWEGNVLIDRSTGDSLKVNENCFNVLPVAKKEEKVGLPAAVEAPVVQPTPDSQTETEEE